MRKYWQLLLVSFLGLSLVSCSGTQKKGEGASAANSEKAGLTFNPQGSDSGQISGLMTVRFAYDQSRLSPQARKELTENAEWLKKNKGVNLVVEGHCDTRGSTEYNLALGERRAQAVKTHLVSLGIDSQRISTISYGKEKLLNNGDSEAAHAQNRRANFLPIPQ